MGCANSSGTSAPKPKPVDGRTVCGPHLKKADDLKDHPLFPDGTKSLCCKYLSKEIWDEYKD